jgi:predicted phage terminase large subunit-like protein
MTNRITQSWDTAIKAASHNDASACATFEEREDGHYLLDMWVGRVEYPALKRAVQRLAKKYQPDAILIEDKASGQSLIQDLRREQHLPIIAVHPKGDKLTRFAAVTPIMEAGKVWLPHRAPWLIDLETELLAFPHGPHDDQVDAISQYLNWVKQKNWDRLRVRRL